MDSGGFLNIVGQGPEENAYRETVERQGLEQHVRFWRRVPYDQIVTAYAEPMFSSCLRSGTRISRFA